MLRNAKTLLVAAVILGLVLRLIQYVRRGSLWIDEASLALSIVSRPARELVFTPLDEFQVAPPGFLQAVNLSTVLLGDTEPALRLPALIASLVAMILFAILAAKMVERWEAVFATVVFALSPRLLTHAADAKQYAGDLLCSLALTLAILELRRSQYSRTWRIVASVLGLMVVWISDASALVLIGLSIGALILAIIERDRRGLRALAGISVVWCIAIVAQQAGVSRRMSGGAETFMHAFWKGAFVPFPPASQDDLLWLPARITELYGGGLGIRGLNGITVLIALYGLIELWRRKRRDAVLLLAGPIAVAVIASAAGRYPFVSRLILFLFPAFCLFVVAGVGGISRLFPRYPRVALVAMMIVLLRPERFVLTGERPPWRRQEMKAVLASLQSGRKPGDRIYVSAGASPAVRFYGNRFGLEPNDWIAGKWEYSEAGLKREFEPLAGSPRAWVILAHDQTKGLLAKSIRVLDSLGARIPGSGYEREDEDAWLLLYDLSRRPTESR